MKRGLLVCMVVVMLGMTVLSGCKGNSGSSAPAGPSLPPTLYVGNFGGGGLTISVFKNAVTASADAFEDRVITSPTNSVRGLSGLLRDPATDQLYVAGFSSNSVGVYDLASTASGTTAPARIITSVTATTMRSPFGLWLDKAADRLYVSGYASHNILVFDNASTANGATVPSRIISSATTTLRGPCSIWLDEAADQLYVAGQTSRNIVVYNNASTANGNTVPSRIITSATTTIADPVGIWLDKAADRLFVSGFIANNITVFNNASTANGSTVPARVIEGVSTTLSRPTSIQLDLLNDTLYTANSSSNATTSSIVVFHSASTVSGDVAPSRIITTVNSALATPYGLWLDFP